MSKLRIFNPEHDLALAFGGTNYTPPPLARILRRDLQMLPCWIASHGDFILSQNHETDSEWIDNINNIYGIGAGVCSIKDIGTHNDIEPWGWNKFLQRRMFLDGAKPNALPSDKDIENIRFLSHRRISIKIHKMFLDAIPELQENIPHEYSSMSEILDFARKHPKAYVKAPWSSSGKGVYRALDINALDFTRWCSGIIKRQGSIMCEKPLSAVMDFAMEFKCTSGNTTFEGYSIFNNDTHCSFNGGLLMSTDKLHEKICSCIGNEDIILKARECATQIISHLIAPHYSGYVGIDMMIYKDMNGSLQLNPCIELNLRTTMGVISSVIGNKFLHTDSTGIFHVEFHKSAIDSEYIKELEKRYPLQISSDGKIKSGVQFLSPLYPDSQYCAYILVHDQQ